MGLNVDIQEKVFSQGSQSVLTNCKFVISSNEIVSIVGPSGIGKSTLLRLIASLDSEYFGEITFNGSPLSQTDTNLAMCFQEPRLYPWLDVEQNVKFSSIEGGAQRATDTLRCLEMVGMLDHRRKFPKQLSGGMAQRVSIARALARSPELLLLDEPFSALDFYSRENLQQQLLLVLETQPATTLLVTHDVEEAVLLSDRILVLSSNAHRSVVELIPFSSKPRNRFGDKERKDMMRVLEAYH